MSPLAATQIYPLWLGNTAVHQKEGSLCGMKQKCKTGVEKNKHLQSYNRERKGEAL